MTKIEILILINIIVIVFSVFFYRYNARKGIDANQTMKLGIQELITKVKSELVQAEQQRIENEEYSLFALQDFDLEIKFVVSETTTAEGNVSFNVVTVSGDKSMSSEKIQTIKLHMSTVPPVESSVPGGLSDKSLMNDLNSSKKSE